MAFCGYCGQEHPDGEVCSCMEGKQVETPQNQGASSANATVEKIKNIVGKNSVVAIAAVAVVVILIVAVLLLGGGSYKAPIDDYIAVVNKKSMDATAYANALRPDFAAAAYKDVEKSMKKSDYYADVLEDQKDNLEEYYEDLDDELGKWKLSFEMKSKKKLSKGKIKDYQENFEDRFDGMEDEIDDIEDTLDDDDELEELADELDMDEKDVKALAKSLISYYKKFQKVKVTEGYEVKGKFIIKTKDDEYKTETVEMVVLKVNGDWCYAGTSDGSVRFDMDGEEVYVGFIENHLNSNYAMNYINF